MSASQSRSDDYVRFIILSGARTGSNMLAQALNSNSTVTCFRETFNFVHDFVQFNVEGYDNFSAADLALRTRDPIGFLEQRIYCHHPGNVRAVGFKFQYPQFWGFPGLLERIVQDKGIRVLHLRRRNLVRMQVSLRLARATGVFMDEGERRRMLDRFARAARHPLRTLAGVRRRLGRRRPSPVASRPRVSVSAEEVYRFIIETRQTVVQFDDLLRDHPKLTVFYEDMVDRHEDVFARAQEFLGVQPQPLTVTMRRQNPEPLRELIENYDELYEAFKGTPQEEFFE